MFRIFGSKIENKDILVQLIELAILYRKIENLEGLYYFGRNDRNFFVGQQYGLYVVDIYCSIGPLISVWLVLHNIVNLNKVWNSILFRNSYLRIWSSVFYEYKI